MGWVLMSERELQRVEVLTAILAGRQSVTAAARLLGLSRRHVHRLINVYRAEGASVLRHGARGRRSNRALSDGLRELALVYVREHYADFGPTLASEMLRERHQLPIARETLRTWMIQAGLWLSRQQRRALHQPRLRRERFGELVQIDGSEHRWFEDRADPCTLIVFIDDATGKILRLRFIRSESAFSYFETLEGYLEEHGRPVALYSDKHAVFRVSKTDAKGGQGMTQFGRALGELGIEIICANSSQAKGRVERVNRTLQDRLVKALRVAGISSIAEGNDFLLKFVHGFNDQFSVSPARSDDLHRPLNLPIDRLRDILAWREQRHVGYDLALSYRRKRIILDDCERARSAAGQYVDTYEFSDGRLDIRFKGLSLLYRSFDKDQRVTHTAIVENKRLSEVLSWIKDRQDEMRPIEIKTNSAKNGYVRRGRKLTGSVLER
ncbi:ISNCY family transposase [Methylorubrum populi]|uniref:Transposase n=1 Tax=Methylorubrum populi TaxID=223967 RepID=A0A833MWB1_9HYPH|nr:Transposase [Methylorubrum populi]